MVGNLNGTELDKACQEIVKLKKEIKFLKRQQEKNQLENEKQV